MKPILGRIGPFLLYSYTALLAAGVAGGVALTVWLGRERPLLPRFVWIDGALAALVGALLGGRLAFVVARWDYFATRLALGVRLWNGGFAYAGAVLGGGLALALWALARRRPVLPLLAQLSPGVAVVYLAGWIGCWLEGCAYGRETAVHGDWRDWLAADLPDHLGVYAWRYQSQLLAALLALLLLALVIVVYRRRGGPGFLAGLTLLGVSLIRLAILPLRGDPAPLLAGLRGDAWIDGALALLAVIFLLQYWRSRPARQAK
jgi:phosphatidylglycerol:prolipoprotein diacylglycerol transferase